MRLVKTPYLFGFPEAVALWAGPQSPSLCARVRTSGALLPAPTRMLTPFNLASLEELPDLEIKEEQLGEDLFDAKYKED